MFLLFAFLILSPSALAAESTSNSNNIQVNQEDLFFDPVTGKNVTVFKSVNGIITPMDEEEYLELVKRTEMEDPQTQVRLLENTESKDYSVMSLWYRYIPSRTSTYLLGPTYKSSATVDCTVSSCTVSKTVNTTYTNSFTAGLNADMTKVIKANAGFSWTTSATNGNSYSFTVSKGSYGYMGFQPYYRKTTGTLESWSGPTRLEAKTVEGRSPHTIGGGELDGIYKWVEL